MRLLKFERPDGSDVWINPDHVSLVSLGTDVRKDRVQILMAGGHQVVIGELDEVVRKLAEAAKV